MKISDAKKLIREVIQYNLTQAEKGKGHNTYVVPFVQGDPGLGKTAAAKQVAEELAIPYRQCIIAQYDAGELAGLPFKDDVVIYDEKGDPSHTEARMVRLRPHYLPTDKVAVFNLDELPQAFLANQNIASQLVNEYRVGEHEISPGVTIVATGNKPANKAGTTTMPTHLKDRLLSIEIEPNKDDFMGYAIVNGIDSRIRAWIENHPNKLHDFDPTKPASPTPRSWEKVSAILSMDLPAHVRLQALAGQIGEGHATEFEAYCQVAERMPKLQDIINNPTDEKKAPAFGNKDANILYLLLSSLSDVADEKNIGNILKYVDRLPREFAAFFGTQTFTRNKDLLKLREVSKWKLSTVAPLLYS
jgi:hypothetical protein